VERSKLFVGGLAPETTRADLVKLFSTAGAVFGVKLVVDRDSGRSKGIAYVEMATETDARAALKKLDGARLGGKRIFVVAARAKDAAPAAPRYGSGPGMIERRSGKDRRRVAAPAPAPSSQAGAPPPAVRRAPRPEPWTPKPGWDRKRPGGRPDKRFRRG